MSVLRVSHVGVCVSELPRALRFWRDGLGFREVSRLQVAGAAADTLLELDGTRLEAVYLERDGTRVELLHFAAPGTAADAAVLPPPMNAPGLTHVSVRVDDLDAAARALAEAGGRVLAQTRTHDPALGAGAVFVLDPDGTRVELVQAPGDPGKPPGAS